MSVTDGNGNTTNYVLDDKGRVYQEISPDTGTTTYQYDPTGNVIAKTDARGITVSYSYDAVNRLTLVDFPTDTDIVYTYDTCTNGKGRLCQVVDQAGTTSYSYSPRGELVQEDKLILGVNYTTGYQYDDNGNLEVLTYPSGRTVTYVYDNADQVTTVLTTPSGGAQQSVASSISYMPFGSLASMTHGNGLVRTVGHDLQYRVTSLQTGALQDLTYVPDANGNVQDIVDNLDPNKNKSFSYDSINRLDGATGPWGSLSWTYDDVGNRLTYTDGSGTTNYGYFTGTNRLQALTGATTKTFSYTNAGNTETEDTRQYVYNESNRLIQVNEGGVIGDYTYNGYGERVVKVVQGATTIFHYDHNGTLIGESDGVNFEEYIYLGRTPIAKASGQDLFFIHADHLDTPRIMTNAGGASVWNLEVRPFGDSENVTGTATLNLRFPGQYYDDESGMNYNYFRMYRQDLGRYLEADPIGLAGGFGLYSYANSAPTVNIDLFGLKISLDPQNELPPGREGDKPQIKPSDKAGAWIVMDHDLFPCKRIAPGNYGFNARIIYWLGIDYLPGVDPNARSAKNKSMSLKQEEEEHQKDYRKGLRPEKINEEIQTEGFCTPQECEKARSNFGATLDNYRRTIEAASERRVHRGGIQ